MDSFLHRYRNVSVLFVAIVAQIAAIAWQVRQDNDVPLLRVWAVSAVTPVATAIENIRSSAFGIFGDFFAGHGSRDETRTLRADRDRLRLENQLLKDQLATAQQANALAGFAKQSPSKMIGARVIGMTTGMGTHSVLIDRGSFSGVEKGMAVVTPDGIVGKVLQVYKFASQVLSVTDAGFAASVESQKNHTRGVMKGLGNSSAKVDYVPSGQKVDVGEVFYTSGDDRVFPRGMPAGKVTSVKDGATFQEIYIDPFAAEATPEEVFVLVDPVHQQIPEAPPPDSPVFLAPDTQTSADTPETPSKGTQADQLVDQYKKIGAAQNHEFGQGATVPNFNLKVPGVNAPMGSAGASGGSGARSASGGILSSAAGSVARAATGGSGIVRRVPVAATGGSGAVHIAPRPVGVSGLSR
jgi:rod shape-determining protein MreC